MVVHTVDHTLYDTMRTGNKIEFLSLGVLVVSLTGSFTAVLCFVQLLGHHLKARGVMDTLWLAYLTCIFVVFARSHKR